MARRAGSFTFNIECHSPTYQQTMEVTLRDGAGNQSSPARFSYTCVEAGPQDVAQSFLAIINQYRSQSGQCFDLAANAWTSWPAGAARNLVLSPELNAAAVYHSQFMADHDCFAHVCPGEADVRTRIEQFGYTGWTSYGENIYKATQGLETPEAAFEAWRNSPGHNKNMLTCQFEEIGVGRGLRRQLRVLVLDHRLREPLGPEVDQLLAQVELLGLVVVGELGEQLGFARQ
jgi:uncharacterized protein YkwD